MRLPFRNNRSPVSAAIRRVTTDTAALAIFDPAAISHRKDGIGDWWSLRDERLLELEAGHALVVGLGTDGTYQVCIEGGIVDESGVGLKTPSGRIFIGPGEEMTGGGFEPDGKWGGFFVPVQGAFQRVGVQRDGEKSIVRVEPTVSFVSELSDTMRLWGELRLDE